MRKYPQCFEADTVISDLCQHVEMKEALSSPVTDLADSMADWHWATIAATLSAVFAGIQILLTRRDEARKSGSGLSCHYYEQAKLLPKNFRPQEPGPWHDPDLVFRLDNVSGHPYVSVVATLELANDRYFSAYADWVAPNSTMYCVVGSADEHDFMFMKTARTVRMTYLDSSGRAWHRTADGQLTRARHPFRHLAWWISVRYTLFSRLTPDLLKARGIFGKANLGATLHGLGDKVTDGADYMGTDWNRFVPSQQTVNWDRESVPQREYEPTDDDWKLWKR